MKKIIIALVAIFALATAVYAGTVHVGKVTAFDGEKVTFELPEHDLTVGDKIQMGFGAQGNVTAVNGANVTVEFPRAYRELDRKFKNQGRIQLENGGKDGKFTAEMKGC